GGSPTARLRPADRVSRPLSAPLGVWDARSGAQTGGCRTGLESLSAPLGVGTHGPVRSGRGERGPWSGAQTGGGRPRGARSGGQNGGVWNAGPTVRCEQTGGCRTRGARSGAAAAGRRVAVSRP